MKIIQINCVFRKGSTGRVTAAIHDQLLQNGDESQVIYGRGERLQEVKFTQSKMHCGQE